MKMPSRSFCDCFKHFIIGTATIEIQPFIMAGINAISLRETACICL